MYQVDCVLDARAALGECPRWDATSKRLYWVDIARQELHRFDPATGTDEKRTFDQPVGCFAVRAKGGFVLAMRDGFWLLDEWEGTPRPVEPQVEAHLPENRFNDGRCDAQGRFWAGTMDGTKKAANGTLWRLDPDLSLHRCASGTLTSNGLAFAPDGRTMYWSDTPNHIVRAYGLDPDTGALGAPRTFATFAWARGRPDGAAVDSEGCYWSALYDGGRVVRLSPEGRLLAEVAIPSRHCTMIAFGGEDLRTAYVTTAAQGLDAEELARRPRSGGLFAFRVDVPGLPEHRFGG
ncbi:MAG TPA: SMP-30/gluconolactonase/LRE family protein [Azospirillaceae bacterium]|nr:SMP-30/gluconolactonase/LRE family protein [Azospirillaceae bacterium]